jgi:hypothetical protein
MTATTTNKEGVFPMINLTKAQRKALHRVWLRTDQQVSYLTFRKTVQPGSFGCVMVRFAGMWLGVEKDGHTHS